jgi:predicted aspartyl protease
MKFYGKWICLIFVFFVSNILIAQKLSINDVAEQWKNQGFDKLEGIYGIYDKEAESYNKELLYGIIRYYNSHRLFICKDLDNDQCIVVGTLKDLSNNSFLTNIELKGDKLYNIELIFNSNFNKFELSSYKNLEFTKIYPKDETEEYSGEDDVSLRNEIEVELSGSGVFEVPVLINGVLKLFFIIDTGASETQISPDVFLTLYRSKTIDNDDRLKGQEFTFADGSSAFSDRYMLHSLEIGGVEIKNVPVSISKSIKAPILLGQNVLSRLGKFRIDYANKKLIITK